MIIQENKNQKNEQEDSSGLGRFINPDEIIKQLEIRDVDSIADFGCGTGFFAMPLGRKLKNTGRVYAFDVLKEKIESVESQAKLAGLNNIFAKRVNLELLSGSKMLDKSVDWVLLVNMLFQNKNKGIIIEESARVLKDGGKIFIMEWDPEKRGIGPAAPLRISKEAILDVAQKKGLTFIKSIDVSDQHYGLVFSK